MTHYADLYYPSFDKRLTLYARDYARADAPLTLLLMHGLTRNSADFEPLCERLKDRYRLIVPDMRGRGLSAWDDQPQNYLPPVYAQDMLALLDQLALERVVLVGTSMGGIMAMIMAATQPQRFAGIVLNDVGPKLEEEGLAAIRAYVGKGERFQSWSEAAAAIRTYFGAAFPDFLEADWQAFAKRCCVQKSDHIVFAYDPKIAEGLTPKDGPPTAAPELWGLWDMLKSIPILALRGGLSTLLSAQTLEKMAKGRDKVSCVTIPNRGHAPLLNEAEAIDAINGFLSALE